MSLHRFETSQTLPIDPGEAWDFFADPRNLALITPPELAFEVVSPLPERMHPGLIVRHRLRPFGGVRVDWITGISHLVEGELFVDEQRPYRFWRHRRHFRPAAGGVEIGDIVHYAAPFGPPGDLLNALLVEDRVRAIFDYRRRVPEQRFGRAGSVAACGGGGAG